jgi:hypothetical protein
MVGLVRHIDSLELARMTGSAVESLNDRCDRYAFVGSTDSTTGEVLLSWDTGTFAIRCGFVEANEIRNERGQIITIDADAILRVPQTQALTVQDKIIARGKTYAVDGVTPGRNVTIGKLVEIKV